MLACYNSNRTAAPQVQHDAGDDDEREDEEDAE